MAPEAAPWRSSIHATRPNVHSEHRAQVDRQGHAPHQGSPGNRHAPLQAERAQQRRPSRTAQPVAGHGGAADAFFSGMHQVEQGLGHRYLAATAAPGQQLDAVQRLVARGGMLGFEHLGGEHQPHQRAGAGDDLGPVGVANGAQRRDGIAHAQVVGGLVGGLLRLHRRKVGQRVAQPFVVVAEFGRATVLQALRHLSQEHAADPALVEQLEQLVERGQGVGFDPVAAQVGHLARRLVGGHALGQAAQAFDQDHAQGGGQRPHLAELELAGLLVGAQELRQQLFVECAIGVGHEGPGHAIDPRQAGQRLVLQHRQGAKVASRQALVDLLELRFDQVEVVEQPFGRRADVVAGGRLHRDVAVRLAQGADVALQAGKEGRRTPGRPGGAMGFTEAAAMLRKALQPEDLGANRWIYRAACACENVAQGRRCIGQQPQQLGLRHGWGL